MNPLSSGRAPSLAQWAGASSTMNASVVLDQPGNVAYTNLDLISGRVVVRTGRSTDISNIVVKLEGESRSRLMTPPGPEGQRPKPVVEYHKVGRSWLLRFGSGTDKSHRFCIECRWCFRPRKYNKIELRWLQGPRTHYQLDNMSIRSASSCLSTMHALCTRKARSLS